MFVAPAAIPSNLVLSADVKLISVNREGVNEIWYPYLSNLYYEHNQHPFLIKVLDTEELEYEQLNQICRLVGPEQ